MKNTGYGQAARISLRELYGVSDLSASSVEQVQAGYEKLRRPGFYRQVLCEMGKIESCQVNCLRAPFLESKMPALMMQDLSIVGMFTGPSLDMFGQPTGIVAAELGDWHQVIDWWFDKYGTYAVAVKSQDAYRRDIDYAPTPADKVEDTFRQKAQGQPVGPDEQKALEDHLFWYAVQQAADAPVAGEAAHRVLRRTEWNAAVPFDPECRIGLRTVPQCSQRIVRIHAHLLPVL